MERTRASREHSSDRTLLVHHIFDIPGTYLAGDADSYQRVLDEKILWVVAFPKHSVYDGLSTASMTAETQHS